MAYTSGGTWLADDRFVWATRGTTVDVPGKLMQWTPTGGATVLRSEYWYNPTSSPDGRWLAGVLATTLTRPRVFIAPLGGGRTFQTGLASNPGFVTATVVWYAEEKLNPAGYDPTSPDGVIHALDVTNHTDRIVVFNAGEAPKDIYGNLQCCSGQG